ncbi:MAG: iron-containing alcohol dehydrogenase [Pseudohongiellaceae bacterium]
MNQIQQPQAFQFHYSALESVTSGSPAESALASLVKKHQAKRVLLLGSATLGEAVHDFAAVKHAVEAVDPEIKLQTFCKIRTHTPREDVLQAIDLAHELATDLLISVGGGSIIDACKVVQLALNQNLRTEQELVEYAQASDGTRGSKAGNMRLFSTPSLVRQIAVPTTLSGAEFSNNAGVLNTKSSSKEGYKGIDLCPREIVYDPFIAQHTPEWLWLSTAIRSLDHAIEGYCSGDAHPFLQGNFLHAIKLFGESLPLVKQEPRNVSARSTNQQAVWLACCGLGTVAHGASHGIGYILGSFCGVPHGLTSCVMLPAVLEWNEKNAAELQAPISQALGRTDLTAANAVRALVSSLGLPVSLREVGVIQSDLREIAQRAFKHPVVKKNPRQIESVAQVEEILQIAW